VRTHHVLVAMLGEANEAGERLRDHRVPAQLVTWLVAARDARDQAPSQPGETPVAAEATDLLDRARHEAEASAGVGAPREVSPLGLLTAMLEDEQSSGAQLLRTALDDRARYLALLDHCQQARQREGAAHREARPLASGVQLDA
jgi:hypothetical protein